MDELLNAIKQEFDKRYDTPAIKALLEKTEGNNASYKDAQQYAEAVGDILSESIKKHLSAELLPDEQITEELARQILEPTLTNNYNLITDVTERVQKKLNADAGIGLKAIRPTLNTNRIEGLIRKSASYETYEKAEWLFGEPIVNFSQNVVNDSIRANVDSQARAGLRPKLIRRAEIGCCKWCANLAGVYDYDKAPDDIYRRHEYCRCIVEYAPGDGTFTNVHTKKEYDIQKQNRIDRARRIDVTKNKTSISKRNYTDVTREYIRNATPGIGRYIEEEGFRDVQGERKAAEWLSNTFGGDIILLAANQPEGHANPDYLWNGKLWDLKIPNTTKPTTIDQRIRQGIKQINENPGGIIIDLSKSKLSFEEGAKIAAYYSENRAKTAIDTIVKKGEKYVVFHIKK